MDIEIIERKKIECAARAVLAMSAKEDQQTRIEMKHYLTLVRMQARAAHNAAESKRGEFRALERAARKAEAGGITCVLTNPRIEHMRMEWKNACKELADVGLEILVLLDLWQLRGATFEDLCNICNRNPEQVRKQLGETRIENESFSTLVWVHNLDYKDPRETGWIEDSIDAPFTHALKEYWLYRVRYTEKGKKAAHEAMNAVFPEIMENALTAITDEDGVRRLYDKDGEEIAVLGEEDV